MKISIKKFRLNDKYGMTCTTTEIKDGTKRYSVEVNDLESGTIKDRKVNIKDKNIANLAFERFKIMYSQENMLCQS